MRAQSILVLTCVFMGLNAFAESSFELSCRIKAKEIAAETYKGCVTEFRQSQLEQIRSEYKQKLSDLKNHYDKELRKIGPKSSDENSSSQMTLATKPAKKQRASGARTLPKKSVKTEIIDLTTPAPSNTESSDEITASQSQNRLNSNPDTTNDVEIVELPSQE